MSIYSATTHEELRREVVALCMEVIDEKLFNSGVPSLVCCDRIVPRVPDAPVYAAERAVITAAQQCYDVWSQRGNYELPRSLVALRDAVFALKMASAC
jgi:hypothetical protein